MSDFEKQYYESEKFWSGDVLQDEMNRNRISFTASLIPPDVKSLVDVGCGNGIFLNYLKANRAFERMVGTDRSEVALRMVQAEKILSDITQLPFANSEFDCATCLEVIEHLPQETYRQALKEIARVSAKYIIITVPYNEDLLETQTQCPRCKSKFNSDLHLRSFQEKDMQALFLEHGFECSGTKVFFPFKRNVGAKLLEKLEAKEKFQSPICPICGYENESYEAWSPKMMEAHVNAPGIYNRIKQSLKKVWPKETVPGFWIAGIYTKK
ncbi:MAG: class I SAM-dependent methyltransferase [Bacteroidetes bacterium]|nr:class I SAM-dependent methyltransferase [Bacteroidota bacterium]